MLKERDQTRARAHLGFSEVHDRISISMGIPMKGLTRYLVDDALRNLRPTSEELVLRCLDELDCILDQLSKSRALLDASQVDTVKLRGDEQRQSLEKHYAFWQNRLANLLGVVPNPVALPASGDGPIVISLVEE